LGTQRTRKFCRDTQGGDCYQLPLSHEHSKKSSRFYTRNPAQTLPPLYDAGEHAAFTLPSGFLMHKLSWRLDDRYEVVAFEEATKNLDYAAWSHADRFGRPDAPTYQKYSAVYFIKSASPHKTYEPIPMSESVKQGLLNIFSFYSNALESVRTANSDENFDHARLNLLSIDNAWQFLRDFGDKTLKSTPSNMLRLDKDVAAAYLKFHSLIWQYEAVKETFTKPDNEGNINESIRKRKELYKKHYLKDIDFLRAETYTHFAARGVPPEEMPALFDRLMARIKEQLPIVIDAAGSGEGMQFYKLLDETCR
jgi:hypothetical protein